MFRVQVFKPFDGNLNCKDEVGWVSRSVLLIEGGSRVPITQEKGVGIGNKDTKGGGGKSLGPRILGYRGFVNWNRFFLILLCPPVKYFDLHWVNFLTGKKDS